MVLPLRNPLELTPPFVDLHPGSTPAVGLLCELMSSSSVAGAKGRSKTALGPGYSLMAWMRPSQGADLSGGVGAVDPDEDEAKWKEWDVRLAF